MRAELLVCPGCRTMVPGRIELRTLEHAGDFLACACGRRYPIIDDIPVVAAVRDQIVSVVERDLSPEVSAALVADGPDEAPYARMLEHVSTYMDAHWGDLASPPLPPAAPALATRLAELAPVEIAVELGCSAGRSVLELCARAGHVVGLELNFATVRRARRVLDGQDVAYARRMVGRHYAPASVRVPGAANRTLVCGDALDPPLVPGAYNRVVALNMLDSVANPRQLLSVVDGLCRPGGEIILASPFSWQSSILAGHAPIGGADPAGELARILSAGEDLRAAYTLVDQTDLTWTVRRDARSEVSYKIHYVRARKGG